MGFRITILISKGKEAIILSCADGATWLNTFALIQQ
jgi:hypothetical protein